MLGVWALLLVAPFVTRGQFQSQAPRSRTAIEFPTPMSQPAPPNQLGIQPVRGVGMRTLQRTTAGQAPPAPRQAFRAHDINVDTALAKIMAPVGDFFAQGWLEFWTTNSGAFDFKQFPFTMQVLEGRIRTDLDLSQIPKKLNPDGTWSTMRQIGIDRITSVTLPKLTTVKIVFPSQEAYVTKGLAQNDVPEHIKMVNRVLLGPERLKDGVYDKYSANLEYLTGTSIPVEIWQDPGATNNHPAFIKIKQPASAVSVRFARVQRGKVPVENFDTPEDYSQYSDMGIFLQGASARFEQENSPGMRARSRPGVVVPGPNGSFSRPARIPRPGVIGSSPNFQPRQQ